MPTDPIESANGHAIRIDMLREHGWSQWMARGTVKAMGSDGQLRRCAWIEGLLTGADRSAFIGIDDGRIIMHGEQQDYEFGEFIHLLTHGAEPVEVAKPVVERQRSLF